MNDPMYRSPSHRVARARAVLMTARENLRNVQNCVDGYTRKITQLERIGASGEPVAIETQTRLDDAATRLIEVQDAVASAQASYDLAMSDDASARGVGSGAVVIR